MTEGASLDSATELTMSKPTYQELEERIREVKVFHGGTIPVEDALVWEGYIAALSEWQLISVGDHERLLKLLPKTPAGPSLRIFLGTDGAKETMDREDIK